MRPAFAALWSLDLALADVVATTTDPRLGAIRLAWWRDRLDDLDTKGAPAGEPRLEAIDRHLMPVANGAMLSMIVGAWMVLLEPFPWGEEVAQGLRARGGLLFEVGSQILDEAAPEVEAAGALWSLVDGARHCSDPASRDFLLGEARTAISCIPVKMPGQVRSLTVLAAIAAHDVLKRPAGLRGLAALRHRLWGTIPR